MCGLKLKIMRTVGAMNEGKFKRRIATAWARPFTGGLSTLVPSLSRDESGNSPLLGEAREVLGLGRPACPLFTAQSGLRLCVLSTVLPVTSLCSTVEGISPE
jgi:hypothetical protein